MNRRSYIAGLGVGMTFAGCSALRREVDTFSVSSPTVAQGEIASISLELPEVTNMKFTELPDEVDSSKSGEDGGSLEIVWRDIDFTPPPEVVWTVDPPTWQWDHAQDVTGTIPIQTSADMPIGTYAFSLALWETDFKQRTTEHVSVTVEKASGSP